MQIELINVWQGIFVLLGLAVIFTFKSNALKIILATYWYPFLPMLLFCCRIPVGGSLDVIGRPVHESYCNEALIYALASYYVLLVVLWSYRKIKIEIYRLNLDETSRGILCVLLFLVAVIAYPKAFGIGSQRWNLLPGQWSVVYLSLNGILILSLKKIKSFAYVFQVLITILVIKGGERVDSLMVLFLLSSFSYDSNDGFIKEVKLSFVKKIGLIGILILGIAVGYTRVGGQFNMFILLHNIVAMHTVTDVIHVYFSSFNYVDSYGLNFSPIINQFFSFIPLHPWGGAGKDFNFTEILRNNIYNYGGGLFYSEGNVIMGKIGIVIYGLIYGIVLRKVLKCKSQYCSIFIIIILILQLRMQWYGLVYLYTPLIFSILFIGLLNLSRFLNTKVNG